MFINRKDFEVIVFILADPVARESTYGSDIADGMACCLRWTFNVIFCSCAVTIPAFRKSRPIMTGIILYRLLVIVRRCDFYLPVRKGSL